MTSSKIAEKIEISDNGEIQIKRTFDGSQMLKDAEYARHYSDNSFGSENKLIAQVDPAFIGIWLKEAGVSWSDTEAVHEVIKRKVTSGEFADLRVWQGKY
tara:strand:+ start:512 stop:811 length:300 start_codon:yes stop_codon:yes gene_type:complete